MHWLLDPIMNHYADFNGRTSRKAYWMFTLTYFVAFIVAAIALGIFAAQLPGGDIETFFSMFGIFLLVMVALLVPTIAIHVRRLHDLGYSGWWYLIVFLPFGSLIILVLMCLPSQEGTNKYGPHPYATAEPLPAVPVPLPVPPTPSEPAMG